MLTSPNLWIGFVLGVVLSHLYMMYRAKKSMG